MRFLPRRGFIWGAASAGAAAACVRAPARPAQFAYRSSHPNPASHPMHVWEVQLWNQVARETNGRLEVQVFPNGQLGGQEALVQQVRVGAIQMISIGNSVYSELIPASSVDSIGFAFKDSKAAWSAMAGPLGDYVRKEFEAKGLFIPRGGMFDLGMREITSSTKPIRDADDLQGFRIRVPPSKIVIDLFRTLGASTISLSGNEIYTGLQTHLADGQETPYVTIEAGRFYEVQRYLSVTNHLWTGEWYVFNADAWKALPPDIRAIVERNVAKYLISARNDTWRLNDTLADKLQRLGLRFNTADTGSLRARLGSYYARWRADLGNTVWGLLEAAVGRLG